MPGSSVRICAINFWPGFSLRDGFLGYLLTRAYGTFEVVASEAGADIVLTSVFVQAKPRYPEKTIWIIWENLRPNYDLAHYSISFDFDDYGGRNVRCPYWYAELKWPGYVQARREPGPNNHGFEPLVSIDDLMAGRVIGREGRDNFCAFVAGNPEWHRILAAQALSAIHPVDSFGNVAGRPLRGSKYDLLSKYRFNLCFENSIFPGYYTEKPLHAWVGGCVPLYFADAHYTRDFNRAALVSRGDFATLQDFVVHVRRIEESADAQAEIVAQPLVTSRPSIEPTVAFLKLTMEKIQLAANPLFAAAKAPSAAPAATAMAAPGATRMKDVGKNAPCPCGSGKKYKRCHGATK